MKSMRGLTLFFLSVSIVILSFSMTLLQFPRNERVIRQQQKRVELLMNF